MGPCARTPPRLRLLGAVGATATAAYAWWVTGLHPFTVVAYVAVGIPVVTLALVTSATRGVRGRSPRGVARSQTQPLPLKLLPALPWVALFLVAAGLEGAALALGGRSPSVPTLSTVVDHALAWHGVRFILFAVWLVVGWAPTIRPVWRRVYEAT